MKPETNHEEAEVALAAEALDAFGGEERERLLAHLATCLPCRHEHAELSDAAATLVYLAPERAMEPSRSDRLRARLLARAAADSGRFTTSPSGPAERGISRSTRSTRLTGWVGWLLAAGMAALLLGHHGFHRPLNFGWIAAGILGVLFVGAAAYAAWQREEVSTLRDRMAAVEHRPGDRP